MNGAALGWEACADSFAAMPEMEMALLLGADIGDPRAQLDAAVSAIEARIGRVISHSRDHWTKPWGFEADTLFLNRALLVRTALDPFAALHVCLRIEQDLGRVRHPSEVPTSRTIDIDVLAVDDRVLETPELTLPHPRLHLRRFALAPLCDVAPAWNHPILHRTALELLNALPRT